MIRSIIILLILFMTQILWAYIPGSRMILSRMGELSLKKPLYVEQEVQLGTGSEMVSLKEKWLIEGDNQFRLIVEGEKDLKGQLAFHAVYNDRDKTSTLTGSQESQRLSRPLLEKVLFLKESDNLVRFLMQCGVLTEEALRSEIFKRPPGGSNFQYFPESYVRLGRLGGTVSYILGPPPSGDGSALGLWVEQDQFNILKLKVPAGDEVRFEKLVSFSKGVKWPKEISYSWNSSQGPQTVIAQVGVADMADSNQRVLFSKAVDRRTSEFEGHPSRKLIEEFYLRFR